jgi:hypothetical protein
MSSIAIFGDLEGLTAVEVDEIAVAEFVAQALVIGGQVFLFVAKKPREIENRSLDRRLC